MWRHHGIGERRKAYSNDLGHLLLFITVNPGAGAFSRDFTTNLAPQCRAFSRSLKIEKLTAPLFPGPEGLGDTNDWSINTEISTPFQIETDTFSDNLRYYSKSVFAIHVLSHSLKYRFSNYQYSIFLFCTKRVQKSKM